MDDFISVVAFVVTIGALIGPLFTVGWRVIPLFLITVYGSVFVLWALKVTFGISMHSNPLQSNVGLVVMGALWALGWGLAYKHRQREKREEAERERKEREWQVEREREERERQVAWDSLVKQGDEAFEGKDYKGAIKRYKEAGKINLLSERLREKIAEAEVALARERGIYKRFRSTGGKIDIRQPEERVRQAYVKKLVEEYGYDIGKIKIEVPLQRGSGSIRCDIAIYDGSGIVGIVEAKSRGTILNKTHRGQLKSYMSATPTCKWGVLTNGDKEMCGYRNFQTGEITFGKEVPRIITLTEAARNGDIEAIRALLKAGADIEARRGFLGWTALINAAVWGHTEAIEMLLKAGADIEARDNDGWTALMAAAYEGQTGAIRALIEAGADIEARANNGWTALMVAAINGHTEAIRKLLKAGADIEARDNDGGMAFDWWQRHKDHPEFQEISNLLRP